MEERQGFVHRAPIMEMPSSCSCSSDGSCECVLSAEEENAQQEPAEK